MTTIIDFDTPRDVDVAHDAPWAGRVMHVFDAGWHGIRSATGCLPGHKLAITHAGPFDGEGARHVVGLIHRFGIDRVVYQGFSARAAEMARMVCHDFGSEVIQSVVTHVSPGQFETRFEIDMLREMLALRSAGVLWRIGSVKPGFLTAVPGIEGPLLLNAPPAIAPAGVAGARDVSAVLIPVENTWRKNLYVNVLSALGTPEVRRIYAVNEPSGLEQIVGLERLKLVGFMRPPELVEFMATVAAVLNITLVECQPMTKLEAAAAGTPCLTGVLGLPGLEDHPFTRLTETDWTDRPDLIAGAIGRIVRLWRTAPGELEAMAADWCEVLRRRCLSSYEEFLEV